LRVYRFTEHPSKKGEGEDQESRNSATIIRLAGAGKRLNVVRAPAPEPPFQAKLHDKKFASINRGGSLSGKRPLTFDDCCASKSWALVPDMKWREIFSVRALIVTLFRSIGSIPPDCLRCPRCNYTADQIIFEHERRELYNSPKAIYLVYCPKCGRAISRSNRRYR